MKELLFNKEQLLSFAEEASTNKIMKIHEQDGELKVEFTFVHEFDAILEDELNKLKELKEEIQKEILMKMRSSESEVLLSGIDFHESFEREKEKQRILLEQKKRDIEDLKALKGW